MKTLERIMAVGGWFLLSQFFLTGLVLILASLDSLVNGRTDVLSGMIILAIGAAIAYGTGSYGKLVYKKSGWLPGPYLYLTNGITAWLDKKLGV